MTLHDMQYQLAIGGKIFRVIDSSLSGNVKEDVLKIYYFVKKYLTKNEPNSAKKVGL